MGRKASNKCAYYYQYNNQLYPGGSCNLTSLAMCMKTYALKGPAMGYSRLPDNLLAYADQQGLDRHVLEHIDAIGEKFGIIDKSSYNTKLSDIKEHILGGGLVIVHGNFTKSGHIMVLRGFNEDAGLWQANDPAGHWTPQTRYNTYESGDGVWYPSKWVIESIAPDGINAIWAHLVSKKK